MAIKKIPTDQLAEMLQIASPEQFSLKVEQLATPRTNHHSHDYLEAIQQVSADMNIEPEDVKRLITKPLLQKLTAELEHKGLVKPSHGTRSTAAPLT